MSEEAFMSTANPARHARQQSAIGHFINGVPAQGSGDRHGEVYSPAAGAVSHQVRLASTEDVDTAVEAAARAYPAWAALAPTRRAQLLFRFRELLVEHLDDIAWLISEEHGKLFFDARAEVRRGLDVVEFACGIPHLQKGEFSDQIGSGVGSHSLRQPLGVVAGITPFNFPAMVPMWMFPVALACGNTFVLKPSEKDPSASMRVAELMHEAGFPAGVFNVVNGDAEAVNALIAHEQVAAVSFVGSTPIAETLYREGSARGKRVQALGGAKNHAVVMPDADMDQAAGAIASAAYGSAGERCMAISVAVVVGEAGDALVERLAQRARRLKLGALDDEGAEMGPLVTAAHLERVRGYVDLGVEEGAELVVDGREAAPPQGHPNGFFLGGCLFDRVKPGMRIYREEIFGPVLCVVRVDSLDEAIRLVSEHEYGNGAAIFTRHGGAAQVFEQQVRAGMVGINAPIPVPAAHYSFGGWKRSLFGPLHIYGPDGIRFYTQLKTVTRRWPDTHEGLEQFVMPTSH